MITTETVLVLGAGASIPYGFPDGWTLKNDIWQSLHTRSGRSFQVLSKRGFPDEELDIFANLLSFAAEFSVDAFLENHPELLVMGKLAIAAHLIGYEDPNRLRPRKVSANGGERWTSWGWYRLLFEALTVDGKPDTFHQNRLNVVTFNYDRSLEEFLHRGLQISFSISGVDALSLLDTIEIVHVHGMLAPYDPCRNRSGRTFAPDERTDEIRIAAKHIKIISDDSQAAFEKAHGLLAQAERICFLGFGYHPANCRRLAIPTTANVEGTIYGLTLLECQTKIEPFFPNHGGVYLFRNEGGPQVNSYTNLDYLRHVFSLTATPPARPAQIRLPI